MSIPPLPDVPLVWKNKPSTETPFDAEVLNPWGAQMHALAGAARDYAVSAQQSAIDAAAPTDQMVANALSIPESNSRAAADALYAAPVGVDSARHVQPDTGTDVSVELQTAVDEAAAAGVFGAAILTVRPGEYVIGTPVDVPEGVTVRGLSGATLITPGNSHVLNLASGATVKDLVFRGTNPVGGVAGLTGQYGINAVGAPGARLHDVTIRGCSFEGIEYAAIRIRHTDRFRVESCTFLDTGYSAVQIGCAADGIVAGNFFRGTGVLPSYAPNSYAISLSLDGGPIDPVINPQPTRIKVTGNIVTNQAWEALDTHGGTEIEFSGNILVGCEMGIAVTWRTGTAGSGPQRVVISGNVINGAGYPDLAVRAGMSINGAGDGSSYATAVVTGNYVANHGVSKDHAAQWDPRSGGIVASWCDSITVANNTLDTIRGAGISFRSCTTVNAAGNVFRGVWREAGDDSRLSSCVYVDDAASVTLTGNAIRFHTGGKPNANERAIYVVPGTTNNVVDLGNNWGSRLHENLPRLSQGRGSFNDGIDLGGSTRVTGSTPSQPDGAVKANTPPVVVSGGRVALERDVVGNERVAVQRAADQPELHGPDGADDLRVVHDGPSHRGAGVD